MTVARTVGAVHLNPETKGELTASLGPRWRGMTGVQPHFVRCWVDGGVIGHNPSPRGVYWSARIEAGGERPVTIRRRVKIDERVTVGGIQVQLTTNNDSEWMALREALAWLVEHRISQPMVVYSDSRLIVNQFNGEYRCKIARHARLRQECRALAGQLQGTLFVRPPQRQCPRCRADVPPGLRRCIKCTAPLSSSWRPRDVMMRKLGH